MPSRVAPTALAIGFTNSNARVGLPRFARARTQYARAGAPGPLDRPFPGCALFEDYELMYTLQQIRRWAYAAVAALTLMGAAAPAAAQGEIFLHADSVSSIAGNWQYVADGTAAGGGRLWNPDRGEAKLARPSGSPQNYIEFQFTADAYRPYRLWIRGKADGDAWTNDSIFVQFSGALDEYAQPAYRIGTTDATIVSIETCNGCGVAGWGWEDNGYGDFGPLIYFENSGPQTIRIQQREDGISIDQVVLSTAYFRAAAPGAAQYDTRILSATQGGTSTPPAPAPAPVPDSPAASTGGVSVGSRGATIRGGSYANTNLSSAGTLETRVSSDDTYTRRIALRFGTHDAIPAGASVASAYLTLTVAGGNGEARELGVYRAAREFEPSQVTWNRRNATSSWSSAGGDLAEVYDAAAVTGTAGSKVTFDVTALVRLAVQGQLGASRDTNLLIADTGWPSREGYKQYYGPSASGSVRPVLTVTLGAAPAPAPAPDPAPAPAPAPTPEPSPAPGNGVRLKVLEWNIHHGVGSDGVYDIDRLGRWMAQLNPDVILLNEVEKYTSWGNEDQPARFKAILQSRTGKTWYMHFAQEFGQWSSNGKGHLILSRYPLDSVSRTTITQSSGLRGAGAASQATITVNGRTVNLVVTHLDPYDPDMRLVQARDALRWAAGFAENRILSGDMNAWSDQSSIAEINKTYYDAWTVAANNGTATGIGDITPFGATKKGRIDYIFYSKNAPNLVVVDAATPDTREGGAMPSDHRPVLVTFEVR